MSLRGDGTHAWRGWSGESGATAVVSENAEHGASLSSRLFPKARSWMALGFPLELLSPLSVLRVLYALLALVWPALALAGGASIPARPWFFVACALSGTISVGLFHVNHVSARWCHVLAGLALGAVGIAVHGQPGGGMGIIYLLFLCCLAVFVALFLTLRAVLAYQLATAISLWCALMGPYTAPRALAVAVAAGLAGTTASGVMVLLTTSARRRSTVDPDTGLLNGFGMAARLGAGESAAVFAAVSLTGLGEAREALGYRVGTELLRRAVEDLGRVLPTNAVIGRVEGDELVVVLPLNPGGGSQATAAPPERTEDLVAATAEATDLAKRLVRALQAGRYLVDQIEVSLRAHVGLALAPWDGADPTELIRRASLSARRAESAGQGYQIWDGDHGALTAADLTLLGDLRLASERGELSLAYQPQIDPATGATVSVEALLRWRSPMHGQVSPGRFIPLAERTGLIDRLTDWVLGEALDAQVRWLDAGHAIPVSVNLSARTLTRPDLPEWVQDELDQRDLPASCLTLEVTETAAMADLLEAVNLLRPLHDRGIRISIDDFGTGYTSLAVLPQLPLDELKVDQGFVLRCIESPGDYAIVCSVRDLARRLGLTAVAEGVENSQIAERMTEIGFDLLQGYYFARPMTEDDLMADAAGSRRDSQTGVSA